MDLGDYQNIVASKIKEIRNKEQLTQEQFAYSLEEERSTISNWETAKAQPALQRLLKIYKVFNVSLDEICNITKKKESVIIIDSSILISHPFILYELRTKKIDHIEIPKYVIKENVKVVTNILCNKAIDKFNDYSLYTVRVSSNSFTGSKVKEQKNGKGPDTGDRLFRTLC